MFLLLTLNRFQEHVNAARLGYLDKTLIFPVVQFETFTPTSKKIQYINLNVTFIIIGNINASIRHAFES